MLDLSDFLRLLVWWLPNRKYNIPPGSNQHITLGRHIRLLCPNCNSPQPATENIVERQCTRTGRWQLFYTAYECDTCYALFHVDSCIPDEDALYHVHPWPCPLCQHTNDPRHHKCQNCGAGDDSPD